ncbi:SmdB family multidrug efflux ABC transporter permease/ATP-binding protein [Buchnera aphidicola (Mollitrichosiphum nigrofasciatum)]|uniref:SmdB family multidrug efflux ABC transporter permease/ATP-binding protein n=1 Tax=Buchnera aphidicola TaxID=9 RepID=UPI0031B838D2
MDNLKKFWPILKRLLIYGMKWKKTITIAFIMLLSASIAEVIAPILISLFITNFIIKKEFNVIFIISIVITFILLQIFSATLHYFQTIFFNKTAISIIKTLRVDVMKATLKQPIKNFDTQPIGQIISRITNDTEIIKDLYDTVIATFCKSTALIIIVLIAMFSLEWKMAIIASIIFPLVLLIMIIYQHYSTPILRNIRSYIANINNKLNEMITGIHIIQQFNQEKKFGDYIKKTCKQHYLERMKILKLDGILLRPLLSLLSTILLCGIIIIFIFFSDKTIEVGILYAFISYLNRLHEPLIALTTQQALLQQALVASERIFELIDSPKQKYGNDNKLLQTGKITIKNLTFSYTNNKNKIIDKINITIPSKQFTAFIGPTGSGKSTLANLLIGYYEIKKGNIFIDKRPLSSLSNNVLRKGIAIVNQEPTILAESFLKNITLGRKISEKKIWKILKIVNLKKFVQSQPKGLHSKLVEKGNNLSSGQKQLLAIARILVTKPKILILDEATANIDHETEKIIQKSLLLIKKHTTLIVITHRLSAITQADLIVVLDKGKIVESGTHKKLINIKKKYWKMQKKQIKI